METPLEKFDAVNSPLLPGINLIEASAGTGKTYTIAMLVLRFVVEKELDIKQILVMTFTKAATEELKDRIRTLLQEAKQLVSTQNSENNNALSLWILKLNIKPHLVLQRLNHALFDIDQASIFTIHGFCQRILSEHALQSGQLFDSELTGDISAIKQACTDDFWRQHIYTRSAWEISLLTTDYQTPDQLQASVNYVAHDFKVFPEYEDLEERLSTIKQQVETKKAVILTSLQVIQTVLEEGKFKKSFIDNFAENSQCIINWLDKNLTPTPDFSIFTTSGLENALNGNKFRESKKNPLPSEQQKINYIKSLEVNSLAFECIDSAITSIKLTFRRALLHTLRSDVNKRLEQLNVFSFDQLISRLDSVLRHEQGQALCEEIKQCYQLALIDEFQDTDENQWFIISTLFDSIRQYLYLIGDPKQAIYKFRGADINSYFAAQKQAQHCFTLSHNWRSHPLLVAGVNYLFKKPNPFYSQHLKFHPVQNALTSEQGEIINQGVQIPPIILWQLDKGASDFWTAGKADIEIQRGVVNEILNLLSTDFSIQCGNVSTRTILAKDIAILVRSNIQAQNFQQSLNEVGITAVINSKESVFSSKEAIDLYILLQAIAQPTHNSFVSQALALAWFNKDGQQLFKIINNEVKYGSWISRLQNYQLDWQNIGVLGMMRNLISKEKIQIHLTKTDQTERRISNLLHVIELVQRAVIEEHLGITKTLNWLAKNISDAESHKALSDEQQLRLENDDDAVKIITMHGAKGLEFPIVFCPYLWQRGRRLKQEKQLITCYKNKQMIADLGTDQFELHRLIALEEELAEDIRVFYVAVTRAQYRCYINWADVRTKDHPNDSAMAYLMDCAEGDFLTQQQCLKSYSINLPEAFEYRLLSLEDKSNNRYQVQSTSVQLTGKQRQRSLYTSWQMSSYTSLSYLSLQDSSELPEIPIDKAREQLVDNSIETDLNEIPRGAHTGNVIHDLLENIPFSSLLENNDISEQRESSCLRYGLQLDVPELLDRLLDNTVSTNLVTDDACFSLKQLNEKQCLKEMPFYLAVKSFNANEINSILADCPTFQALSEKTMSGYLTGYIDLICEFQGKYYVMDYKSNCLENYQQERLIQAMHEHNYGLQYWIYSLVLHQYLQNRLPDYNYDQHFGGIKYLFVRGMNKSQKNSGVYQTKPELIKIKKLLMLFFP